jgi:hypothetical protein
MSILGKCGVFDCADNRCSEDEFNRQEINNLIKNGKITIHDALMFFNHGCAIYRRAQTIYIMSDSKINIEFQYAARAFASYLNGVDEQLKTLALLDAFQASRHIVNDSLDLILSRIRKELMKSDGVSKYHSIDEFIPDFEKHMNTYSEVNNIVDDSRRKRGLFRYEEYLKMLASGQYEEMRDFLIAIEKGLRELFKRRQVETSKSRKYISNLFTTLVLGVFAIILTLVIGLFPTNFAKMGDSIKCKIYSSACVNSSKTP